MTPDHPRVGPFVPGAPKLLCAFDALTMQHLGDALHFCAPECLPGTQNSGCAARSCFIVLVAEEQVAVRKRAAAQVWVPLICSL